MKTIAQVLYDLGYSTSGKETLVHCPFHEDHSPSCSVNAEKSVYYCFVCGKGGRAEWLLSRMSGTPCMLSPSFSSGSMNAEEREQALFYAQDKYNRLSYAIWQHVHHHFLYDRGFVPRTAQYFCTKRQFDSPYEIVIPITEQHVFKGILMRRATGTPKYLYNRGFARSSTLGGELTRGIVTIVEGELDKWMAWQHGITNVASLYGWKASGYQIEALCRYATGVIIALDNDEAGHAGAAYLAHKLEERNVPSVRFLFPDGKKDFGEMTNKHEFLSLHAIFSHSEKLASISE